MSPSDTGFVLICAAFVLFMTPGLAFFYGGLGRRKNVANNIMASFFLVGVATVMWVTVGFSLAFGTDGKIFTYKIDHAIRIRTGEEDTEAITPAS